MIKENQRLFNQLNVLSDWVILFVSFPLGFWMRFFILEGGTISVPLQRYLSLALGYTLIQLLTFSIFGIYRSFRRSPLRTELPKIWKANSLDIILLLGWLFLEHESHYSRVALALSFAISTALLTLKRIALRRILRHYRRRGYNQRRVILLGDGPLAQRYLDVVRSDPSFGYIVEGYASQNGALPSEIPFLGNLNGLETALARTQPDEVVSALEMEDFRHTPHVIAVCEKAGVRLSIIPFYADYMPSNPQIDDLNGIPILNIRRVPLDNRANAFIKRAMDILGSACLLVLTSPVLLLCAVGVKLSSPGPVIFRQERVGRDKKPFYMYKFRSMRVNDTQDTAWSSARDSRKTRFGAFMRKFSLDEFPQFFNVLKGDMSLVGPRPELPYYVEQFKEDVPLYMVKHQVRPGITGWAQVNGLRGDTSIKERIKHDVYYIEHWSPQFDIQILWLTVFGGKFINDERLD